jgi:hypothetical protein
MTTTPTGGGRTEDQAKSPPADNGGYRAASGADRNGARSCDFHLWSGKSGADAVDVTCLGETQPSDHAANPGEAP